MFEMRLICIETIACLFPMFSLMVDRRRARVVLSLNCYVIVLVHTETLNRRFQIHPFSMCENAVYVWTEYVTVQIFVRFQIYPDMCGMGLIYTLLER